MKYEKFVNLEMLHLHLIDIYIILSLKFPKWLEIIIKTSIYLPILLN